MKKAILFICLFMAFTSYAQNVGLGTTNPGERLDVNGNINVTGTIKTNGSDGTAGQVLMKNSSGNLVWGDMSEFRNLATFMTPGPGTWTVPAGVTRIWVEVWGGGAGGNWYGGGGGGGYVSAILTVVPGNTVSLFIGSAGNGGGTSSTSGGSSQVAYSPVNLTANGGAASVFTALTGFFTPGAGGSFSTSGMGSSPSFRGMVGQSGKPLLPTSYQYNATTFIESCTGGEGGDAGNTNNTAGRGGMFVHNTTTNSALRLILPGAGLQPGGGGGSGFISIVTTVSIGNSNGNGGGGGMVIIHF